MISTLTRIEQEIQEEEEKNYKNKESNKNKETKSSSSSSSSRNSFYLLNAVTMQVDDYEEHLQRCVITNRPFRVQAPQGKLYNNSTDDYFDNDNNNIHDIIGRDDAYNSEDEEEEALWDDVYEYDDDDQEDDEDYHKRIVDTKNTPQYDPNNITHVETLNFLRTVLQTHVIYFDIEDYAWKTKQVPYHSMNHDDDNNAMAVTDQKMPSSSSSSSSSPCTVENYTYHFTYETVIQQRRYYLQGTKSRKKNFYYYDTIMHLVIAADATNVAYDLMEMEEKTPKFWNSYRREKNNNFFFDSYHSLLNLPNCQRATPLIHAAQKNRKEILEELLCYNVSLWDSTMDCYDGPVLLQAAQYGHTEMMGYLLEYTERSDMDMKVWMLVDETNKNDTTPLMRAAQEGHVAAVQLLLGCGAMVDRWNRLKMTPLMLAAQRGHVEICKLLLHYGAKSVLHRTTKQKSTALSLACQRGHVAVVRESLIAGSNLQQTNSQKLTVRQMIQRRMIRRQAVAPNVPIFIPERPHHRRQSYQQRRIYEMQNLEDGDGGVDDDDNDIDTIPSSTDEQILLMLNLIISLSSR
jgi:hypothetical protein